jgi:hypothetical protein
METTEIQNVVGRLDSGQAMVTQHLFRALYNTARDADLLGGNKTINPAWC